METRVILKYFVNGSSFYNSKYITNNHNNNSNNDNNDYKISGYISLNLRNFYIPVSIFLF